MAFELEKTIITIVNELTRTYKRIYPHMVATHNSALPYSERSTRRFMAHMAQTGKLARSGQRGGYLPCH